MSSPLSSLETKQAVRKKGIVGDYQNKGMNLGTARKFSENDVKNQLEGTNKTMWQRMVEESDKRDPSGAYKGKQFKEGTAMRTFQNEARNVGVGQDIRDKADAIELLKEKGYSISVNEDNKGQYLAITPPAGSDAAKGTVGVEESEAIDLLTGGRDKLAMGRATNPDAAMRRDGSYHAPMSQTLDAAVGQANYRATEDPIKQAVLSEPTLNERVDDYVSQGMDEDDAHAQAYQDIVNTPPPDGSSEKQATAFYKGLGLPNKMAKETAKSYVGGGGSEGGGGDGECCIFNEYGGGGCGPCNRGGGPELHTHNNFDNLFGTEKHADMPIQPYVANDGRVFFRFYAIGPGINRHDWGVNSDYIEKNIHTLPGTDITFMRALNEDGEPYYPHPALPGNDAMSNQLFQKDYKVGVAVDYERKPDEHGNWYGIGEALEPHVKEYMRELYEKGMEAAHAETKSASIPIFVSPQILHYQDQDPQDIKKFWFQHVTFTDDPAFPPAFARVTGTCVGAKDKCLAELKHASMSRLELMPCFKMAMEEIVNKNNSPDNTSLISKQGSLNLGNSMNEQPNDPNTQKGNENSNANIPDNPQFPQPQNVDATKVTEHLQKLVADMVKDQSLDPRTKELLSTVESLTKASEDKDKKINDLVAKVESSESREKKRDVELILISYENAFKDKDGKFDEKKFNEDVEYWMKEGKDVAEIKSKIERAMRYSNISAQAPTHQHYAGPGQSSEGQTVGQVFEAPTVGANLPDETETKQASMSGQLLDPEKIYYRPRTGGRIA